MSILGRQRMDKTLSEMAAAETRRVPSTMEDASRELGVRDGEIGTALVGLKLYVASSWRCPNQPRVVELLREAGHEVYDFRHPAPGNTGFHWSEIDPEWRHWTPDEMVMGLQHPIAGDGFGLDWEAMQDADGCVLVLPCGRSSHLEAGYFVGAGKPLWIIVTEGEPELMYRMASAVCTSCGEVIEEIEAWRQGA